MQEQEFALQLTADELDKRIRALRALHELQRLFHDDPELQAMTEDDIVREVKAIRRELYYENSSRH